MGIKYNYLRFIIIWFLDLKFGINVSNELWKWCGIGLFVCVFCKIENELVRKCWSME